MRAARLGLPPAREGEGNLPPFFNRPARVPLPPPRGSAGSGRDPASSRHGAAAGPQALPAGQAAAAGGAGGAVRHPPHAGGLPHPRVSAWPGGAGADGDGVAGRAPPPPLSPAAARPPAGLAVSPLLGAELASAAAPALPGGGRGPARGGGGAEQSGSGAGSGAVRLLRRRFLAGRARPVKGARPGRRAVAPRQVSDPVSDAVPGGWKARRGERGQQLRGAGAL